jgi:hypothetical protein
MPCPCPGCGGCTCETFPAGESYPRGIGVRRRCLGTLAHGECRAVPGANTAVVSSWDLRDLLAHLQAMGPPLAPSAGAIYLEACRTAQRLVDESVAQRLRRPDALRPLEVRPGQSVSEVLEETSGAGRHTRLGAW